MAVHEDLLREFIWGTIELQFLASFVVIVMLLLVLRLIRGFRFVLGEQYTTNFAELVEVSAMIVGILITAYVVADIWAVTFFIERIVTDVLIDPWIFIRVSTSLAVLASGYLLIRFVNRIIDTFRNVGLVTPHQREVSYHVLDALIIAVAVMVVFSLWGDDPTNVVIGTGVLSAILGLAARKTVAAVIAGYALLLSRPFRAGDWVEVAGSTDDRTSGIVQDVTILHTRLRTFNDEHVAVPNDEVTTHRLTNYTRSDQLRVDVEVGVDYGTDLDYARELLRETGDSLGSASSARDSRVVLKEFGDSSILFELQFWIDEPTRRNAWEAKTEAIRAIKDVFDREGIIIPFPQRTHRTRNEDGFQIHSDQSLPDVTESQIEEK